MDDNRDGADTLAMLLRLEGYEAHTSYDGKSALETAQRIRPHIVILDIDMPLLNGVEVAQALRRDRRRYVIISLSANLAWSRREAARYSFDIEIDKPADIEGLLRSLREVVD